MSVLKLNFVIHILSCWRQCMATGKRKNCRFKPPPRMSKRKMSSQTEEITWEEDVLSTKMMKLGCVTVFPQEMVPNCPTFYW